MANNDQNVLVRNGTKFMHSVNWQSFATYFFASLLSFAMVLGGYVITVDNDIEKNAAHVVRVETKVNEHRAQIAALLATQNAANQAAAVLGERISALKETQQTQGETLLRIEGLLQQALRENFAPRQRYEDTPP